MVVSCSYKGCKSRYGQAPGISFFSYPVENSDQCLEWMLRSGNEEFLDLPDKQLSAKKICSLHFAVDYFLKNSRGLKLTKGALPLIYELIEESINICDKLNETKEKINEEKKSSSAIDEVIIQRKEENLTIPMEIIQRKEETNISMPMEIIQRKEETNISMPMEIIQRKEENPSTPIAIIYRRLENLPIPMESEEMNRLRIRLKEVRAKLYNERRKARKPKVVKKLKPSEIKSKLLNDVSKYVQGIPYIFIKMQLKEGKFTPWEKNEKDFALNIYCSSTKLYKTFLNMGFKLPSLKSIQLLKSATDC